MWNRGVQYIIIYFACICFIYLFIPVLRRSEPGFCALYRRFRVTVAVYRRPARDAVGLLESFHGPVDGKLVNFKFDKARPISMLYLRLKWSEITEFRLISISPYRVYCFQTPKRFLALTDNIPKSIHAEFMCRPLAGWLTRQLGLSPPNSYSTIPLYNSKIYRWVNMVTYNRLILLYVTGPVSKGVMFFKTDDYI